MAKIATDTELAAMIRDIVQDAPQRDDPRYRTFLETIAESIGAYYAVEVRSVMAPWDEPPQWYASFHASVDTPCDGGPFATIDTDVTIDEWLDDARRKPDLLPETSPPGDTSALA